MVVEVIAVKIIAIVLLLVALVVLLALMDSPSPEETWEIYKWWQGDGK